jgi:hypothetical protein
MAASGAAFMKTGSRAAIVWLHRPATATQEEERLPQTLAATKTIQGASWLHQGRCWNGMRRLFGSRDDLLKGFCSRIVSGEALGLTAAKGNAREAKTSLWFYAKAGLVFPQRFIGLRPKASRLPVRGRWQRYRKPCAVSRRKKTLSHFR